MCSECTMMMCDPRCPNAPEPGGIECAGCGETIHEGEWFLQTPNGDYCGYCLDEMTASQILALVGEELTELTMEDLQ